MSSVMNDVDKILILPLGFYKLEIFSSNLFCLETSKTISQNIESVSLIFNYFLIAEKLLYKHISLNLINFIQMKKI